MHRLAACACLAAVTAGVSVLAVEAKAAPPPAGAFATNDLLEESRRALGDSRQQPLPRLTFDYKGQLLWLNQGPDPSLPMAFDYRQQTHFDPDRRIVKVGLEFAGPESSFQRSAALEESSHSDDVVELTSHSPHMVLRTLAADGFGLIPRRSQGGERALAAVLHGRLVELVLGADHLPKSLSYAIVDDLHGEAVRRVEYLDYEQRSGWMVPGRIRQSDAGRLTHDLALLAFEAGPDDPDWAAQLQPRAPGGSASDRPQPGIETLAPGIHEVRNLGGTDYHAMLVELSDGLMLLEAPAAIGDGSEVRRLAAQISPRPIRYVVPTHHHDDHAAGAAALARQGAAILTTPGNEQYFTTMATSRRGSGGGPDGDGNATVRVVRNGERIGPVQFLNIGSAGHAKEHLVFYFPDQGILFQSDMGRFNSDGSVEPARPQTCHLLDQIEANGLRVTRIVGGHGRVGTMDDLRRTVRHPESACGSRPSA